MISSPKKSKKKNNQTILNINWMRHCISQNNIIPNNEKIVNFLKGNLKDPNIIDEMFLVYKKLILKNDYSKNLKTDYIFCSTLKRTLETAMFFNFQLLKEGKIKVIPGIMEIGLGKGNTYYNQKIVL